MTPWSSRARDEANLFNPAFCGLVLLEATKGYASEFEAGMPFPSMFLILPLILHKGTRDRMPGRLTAGNGLAAWITNNPDLKVGFPHRMASLKHITRESLLFLLRAEVIELAIDNRFRPTNKKVSAYRRIADESPEIGSCLTTAKFAGRWLANAGPAQNAFALLGVRP